MAEELSFIEEFIINVLNENGVRNLTEDQKQMYIPEFILRINRRMGDTFIAQLEDKHVDELSLMLDDEEVTSRDWFSFWSTKVENFDEQVEKVLLDFRTDVISVLAA